MSSGSDPKPRTPRNTGPVRTPLGVFPTGAEAARVYGFSRQRAHQLIRANLHGWSRVEALKNT